MRGEGEEQWEERGKAESVAYGGEMALCCWLSGSPVMLLSVRRQKRYMQIGCNIVHIVQLISEVVTKNQSRHIIL